VAAAATTPAGGYPAPAYAYSAAPVPGRGGLGPQVAVAGVLLAIIVVVTIGVTAFAVRQNAGSHPTCTSNCSPKIVTALPASATYKSLQYGFEVDYNERWTVRSQDQASIELGTSRGIVRVTGTAAGQSLDQVIQATVAALPSATYQSVIRLDGLKGAHLGDQNGLGAVYAANLLGANSKSTKVRFAIIAATKGNVTVVVFAMNQADPAHFANGMPEGQQFDYMCTLFRWGSS
jgi:hypothetical protein